MSMPYVFKVVTMAKFRSGKVVPISHHLTYKTAANSYGRIWKTFHRIHACVVWQEEINTEEPLLNDITSKDGTVRWTARWYNKTGHLLLERIAESQAALRQQVKLWNKRFGVSP